jgi:hypothetical protein
MVITHDSPTHFRAEDCKDPGFYIDGALDAGVLSFEVVAVKARRRGAVRGHEFFAAMMAHFASKVKVISAMWSDARPDFDTNLKKFNEETRRGTTKQDAAFATKTGTWVRVFGFKAIRSIDTTPEDFPGGYEQVLVDFVKPPRARQPRKRK